MKAVSCILSVLVFSVASVSQAQSFGFDGCYQLYRPNTMYPAIFLSRTAEEGINGSGVRLTIFGTNTKEVIYCGRSSASSMTADTFRYFMDDIEELRLTITEKEAEVVAGKAKLGKSVFDFMKLDEEWANGLLEIASKSCQ